MVTGHKPPSTPVTADIYKNLGLPFYKLWREESEENEGVAGDWSEILGAKEVASLNVKGGASSVAALKEDGKGKGKKIARRGRV
jgi:hypothetical protein